MFSPLGSTLWNNMFPAFHPIHTYAPYKITTASCIVVNSIPRPWNVLLLSTTPIIINSIRVPFRVLFRNQDKLTSHALAEWNNKGTRNRWITVGWSTALVKMICLFRSGIRSYIYTFWKTRNAGRREVWDFTLLIRDRTIHHVWYRNEPCSNMLVKRKSEYSLLW